ncbi:MAG: hypothetical protein RR967_02550 [Anaerovoracaceae bacterium]
MKRVFGIFEVIFDIFYLITAFILGIYMIFRATSQVNIMAGVMSIVLSAGDCFHLVPRIMVIKTGNEEKWRKALGLGKEITSISMTIFYLLLWQIGVTAYGIDNTFITYLIYALAVIRIGICVMPQNQWTHRHPPLNYSILRNIPFFIMGVLIAICFLINIVPNQPLSLCWLAILLSFAFYLPVVLLANKNPKVGMLMFPKTCAYLWILIMCLGL